MKYKVSIEGPRRKLNHYVPYRSETKVRIRLFDEEKKAYSFAFHTSKRHPDWNITIVKVF